MRSESVLTGVFFPRPAQLDGTLDDFRDGDGLHELVAGVAAPEATPEECVANVDLLRLQARGARCRAERFFRILRSDPDVEPVWLEIHGRVHRLQWRVREIRRLVDGLEGSGRTGHRSVDIAIVACAHHAGR